jgi:hypothetical protein
VGLLQPMFLTCYELSGAHFVWWTWHPTEPAALQTKVLGIPVMALYFHSVFGLCLTLWRSWAASLSRRMKFVPNSASDNLFQIIVGVLGVPTVALLFDIPTFIAEYFFGISRTITVTAFVLLSVVVVVREVFTNKSGQTANSSNPWSALMLPRVDAMLYLVVVWFQSIILLMGFNNVLARAYKRAESDDLADIISTFVDMLMGEHFLCIIVAGQVLVALLLFYYVFMVPLKAGKVA